MKTPVTETTIDHELSALQIIHGNDDPLPLEQPTKPAALSQRDIARALNMSLGMTNAILKRLAAKGWLTMHRINGRTLRYAVTPEGTREITRRSYRYLRRTMGHVVRWKEALDILLIETKKQGITRVVLAGASDVDFLVEHLALRHGLDFIHQPELRAPYRHNAQSGDFILVNETVLPPATVPDGDGQRGMDEPGVEYLHRLLL